MTPRDSSRTNTYWNLAKVLIPIALLSMLQITSKISDRLWSNSLSSFLIIGSVIYPLACIILRRKLAESAPDDAGKQRYILLAGFSIASVVIIALLESVAESTLLK